MGATRDLIDGIAWVLDAAGVGDYRPDGPPYTAGDTAITLSAMPDSPDRVLCLTSYPVDDSDLTDAVMAVQVRMRAGTDPTALLDLSDDVFAQLHNRRDLTFGETRVSLIWRNSEAVIGQDVHGRDERTANYYAQISRSAPYLYD